MLFNSFHFLFFFPLVTAVYFALPHRHRWRLLLAASYYFYMSWKAEYLLLIVASTLIDYTVGLKMGKSKSQQQRRYWLCVSLFFNLGMLFAFKYFNFVNDSLRLLLQQFNIFYGVPAFKLLLPVGISFYTFQTLSYSIDVYRGDKEPETHLGIFALYVAFFPQLVAGPIERSTRLLPQFFEKHDFDYDRVVQGLRLILWGLFKKIVIADRLAPAVNAVYNTPTEHHGLSLIIATYFFAFQIYCDFSGYSDIAIGTAQILGFDLMTNFRQPYLSRSIGEFWRRWHISLSTWFKDYLYIPLGGNRGPRWRVYLNVWIVFVVSGLWHGADWTFFIWGALHGFYLIGEQAVGRGRQSKQVATTISTGRHVAQILLTFHLVLLGWIFFRANNLSDSWYILTHLGRDIPWPDFSHGLAAGVMGLLSLFGNATPLGVYDFFISVALIGLLMGAQIGQTHGYGRLWLQQKPQLVRWATYYLLIYIILVMGQFEAQQFIYFQF